MQKNESLTSKSCKQNKTILSKQKNKTTSCKQKSKIIKKTIKKDTKQEKDKNIEKTSNKKTKTKIGFAITGSFCTFSKVFDSIEILSKTETIIPIMSENSVKTDTRFGKSKMFINKFEKLAKTKIIKTIEEAEPIGPKNLLDVLVIAPCTGNTLAKIANGIADSTVTLAAKAQLRNQKPVIIAISTNDGLAGNSINIGKLMNKKNVYFVPFRQDDCINKETSLVADMSKIYETIKHAIKGKQIQPLIAIKEN